MIVQIFFIPFMLLLVMLLYGRYLGMKGTYNLAILSLIICIIISLSTLNEILNENNTIILNLGQWLNIDIINIPFILIIDDISITMLLVVFTITLFVVIYSYDYMINDPHSIRFLSYIILFVFCMLLLLSSTLLPILFIGWEGVGISSFLLISFWYTRIQTSFGAIMAIIINRIGDIFFILGTLFSLFYFNSLNLISIITTINTYHISVDYILFSFILAAMAKSAQLYLHIWLPYSMEAPTPISALIHAATMVTAGVFLLLRLNIILSYSYYAIIFIIIIGSMTLFIGSTLALISLDIKELIAYSTMSQLGYMITIIGLLYFNLSFFHMVFHAYFKSLLFLTAGSIIHSIHDIQDLRRMGGLLIFLPLSYLFIFIGLTSLSGVPFTTGFYSKESIINSSFGVDNYLGSYVHLLTLFTAFITMFYSLKLLNIVFLKTTNLSLFALKNIHYYSNHLILSLSILSFITIFIGYLVHKFNLIYNLAINFNDDLALPLFLRLLPLFLLFIIYIIYYFAIFKNKYQFYILNNFYGFKMLYIYIASTVLSLGYRILNKLIDYGILDLFGPLLGLKLIDNSINIQSYINKNNILPLLLFFIFTIHIIL